MHTTNTNALHALAAGADRDAVAFLHIHAVNGSSAALNASRACVRRAISYRERAAEIIAHRHEIAARVRAIHAGRRFKLELVGGVA